MSKTTKIKWRMSKLPDVTEVAHLLEKGVITKEEAREILFSLETEEERSKKSLQDEIKFLRELVSKLTSSRAVIVENVKYIEKPYMKHDWFQPYVQYYNASPANLSTTTDAVMAVTGNSMITYNSAMQVDNSSDFTSINTF